MSGLNLGTIRIDIVTEIERWPVKASWLLPDSSAEAIAEHYEWLGPRLVDLPSNELIMSSHSYLIRTRHHNILFDTCCGNGKEREGVYPLHQLRSPYLRNLRQAGVEPHQIDYVLCSHLHVDHVGWNTHLSNGEWVPTFPNAKYLVSRREFEWWKEAVSIGNCSSVSRVGFFDSVLPVFDRGLVSFVEDDRAFEDGLPADIRYLPLPGHTPHHCGLLIGSGGEDAILCGDALHHPIQLACPDWVSLPPGVLPDLARATLRDLIARCADSPTRLLTAHFPWPTFGRVISHAGGARFAFD